MTRLQKQRSCGLLRKPSENKAPRGEQAGRGPRTALVFRSSGSATASRCCQRERSPSCRVSNAAALQHVTARLYGSRGPKCEAKQRRPMFLLRCCRSSTGTMGSYVTRVQHSRTTWLGCRRKAHIPVNRTCVKWSLAAWPSKFPWYATARRLQLPAQRN